MDDDTKRRIEAAVVEILAGADMDSATEHGVRAAASERLGIDLSPPDRMLFVRSVVESYLRSHPENPAQAAEDTEKRSGEKELDGSYGHVVCRLSNKRRVTVDDYNGKRLVSIKEFYEKDGKQLHSKKGISLTVEEWEAFSKAVPAIEEAIKKLDGSAEV